MAVSEIVKSHARQVLKLSRQDAKTRGSSSGAVLAVRPTERKQASHRFPGQLSRRSSSACLSLYRRSSSAAKEGRVMARVLSVFGPLNLSPVFVCSRLSNTRTIPTLKSGGFSNANRISRRDACLSIGRATLGCKLWYVVLKREEPEIGRRLMSRVDAALQALRM